MRHLITTSDERSWKTDRPVVFLGEWCCRYDRREAWGALNGIVAAPFGIEPAQKICDIAYVKRVSSELLPELADALNVFHGTRHSVRYWQILLGHWLLRYVPVVFNRYATVEQTLRQHSLSGTTVFDASAYSLATTDSMAFVWACNDDCWNHVLYASILAHFGVVPIESLAEPLIGVAGFGLDAVPQPAQRGGIKQRLAAVATTVLPRLRRNDDAVLLNTYLPLVERLKLEFSLGQSPQVWRTPPLRSVAPEPAQRDRLVLDVSRHDGFIRYLRLHLKDMIPTCYLEGYAGLVQQAEELPWPSAPEFIFTSNNFDTDELFKAWAAAHVESGTRYITGQHGNNYGTHVWAGADCWPERATADRFITWGWADDDPRDVPAFAFRTAARRAPRYRADGGLLLIEVTVPHRIDPQDEHAEFAIYQEEQFRFVEALPEAVRKALTVRLYAEYRRKSWREEERWRDRDPEIRLETGIAPIRRLIGASRLVVHSYDSTGILETLPLNIPTLCFWHGGLDHLLPTAKPYYEQLRAAGILLDSPEQAARAVAEHWNDVGAWWNSTPVQRARRSFCDRYARTVPHPVRKLRKLLRETRYASGGDNRAMPTGVPRGGDREAMRP